MKLNVPAVISVALLAGFLVAVPAFMPHQDQAEGAVLPVRDSLEIRLDNARMWFNETTKPSPSLIYEGHVREKLVALTIDDGPDPRYTPEVLNILEAEEVPATFFVVGREAMRHPELVRREVADGDEVGNHTYTHPDLRRLDMFGIAQELRRAHAAIKEATGGRNIKYFRPPKGFYSREALSLAEEAGYKTILWSLALEGHNYPTPVLMANHVLTHVKPGTILLLHDGRLNRTRSVEALPVLIQGLKQRGYRFVTISQLLGAQQAERSRVRLPGTQTWRLQLLRIGRAEGMDQGQYQGSHRVEIGTSLAIK